MWHIQIRTAKKNGFGLLRILRERFPLYAFPTYMYTKKINNRPQMIPVAMQTTFSCTGTWSTPAICYKQLENTCWSNIIDRLIFMKVMYMGLKSVKKLYVYIYFLIPSETQQLQISCTHAHAHQIFYWCSATIVMGTLKRNI